MVKILRRRDVKVPSPRELRKAVSELRNKRIKNMSKKSDGGWQKGDIAWVYSPDGQHYHGTIIEGPWKCDNGVEMVTVSCKDGDWDTKVCDLRIEKPQAVGADESLFTIPVFSNNDEERIEMPTIKKANVVAGNVNKKVRRTAKASTATAVKNESLCRCGCGEIIKTGREFLQGHDARFHGRVKRLLDGRLSMVDLQKEIQPYAVSFYKNPKTGRKNPKTGRKK